MDNEEQGMTDEEYAEFMRFLNALCSEYWWLGFSVGAAFSTFTGIIFMSLYSLWRCWVGQ